MKNYIVIGGSSGIGKAIIRLLESDGHTVFGTYNQTLPENRAEIHFQQLDVLDQELDLSSLSDSINGLVYCPGSINLKPFHRFTDEDFIDDFRLHAVGAVKIIRQLLPKLKKADSASIVLLSSVAVQHGFSFHAQVSMSKGAVEGLTRALAAELAPNIRVNAIAPSLTDTPLASRMINSTEKRSAQNANNPLKRIGAPEDIAEAAVYLLSSRSSWVTGQILHIDGGFGTLKQ